MQGTHSPLQQLLARVQQSAVISANLAFIVYLLLSALLNPGRVTSAVSPVYLSPAFVAGMIALLTVIGAVILPVWLRWIYLVGSLGYLVLTAFEVPALVASDQMPMHLTLWLTLNILVSFLVFGSRWGVWFSAATIGVMLGALVTQGQPGNANLLNWLTGSIVIGVTAMIAHSITSFIEGNLLVHAQDNERLRAARQDALTDVYGRGAIEEELDRAMEHSRKTNSPMSVIVTDIDHFKVVNDKYGHATGDDVLRAVAKRLRRNVGGTGGMVGRWGGEEFIVLLPGLAKPDALVLAERLRREISDLPLAGLEVTASFGVASYRGAGDTRDQLFGRADMAMYEAKRSGRNAVR